MNLKMPYCAFFIKKLLLFLSSVSRAVVASLLMIVLQDKMEYATE